MVASASNLSIRRRDSILGIRIKPLYNYQLECNKIIQWAIKSESKYVCCANAHMITIAKESNEFSDVLTSADLVSLDGRPIFWLIYIKNLFYYLIGYTLLKDIKIVQSCGRDIMLQTIGIASKLSIPIGFYGGKKEVLSALSTNIKKIYPNVKIDYIYSPPFRCLSLQEEKEVISKINSSNIRILFVSLGCPKQEYWMSSKKGLVQAVMIGVGGAFEVLADFKPKPNKLIQKLGFEWLFRLFFEPKRLMYRNLYYSPKYIYILFTRIALKIIRYLLSKLKITFNINR